ncbi:hypothetical protein CFIMG_004394RA [Ceratocystis fimbriata CBS 114723]|uniref:Uncharacterized protein n=1 Tax=Ceratocystis fimbriata CBS 114723 TaxID=1035309 RepID=A0A2C5WZ37_9PEZI|nr:hypothetical protein CFIMG_004394RA [Ceratocystis fimbriata CBS 114723]
MAVMFAHPFVLDRSTTSSSQSLVARSPLPQEERPRWAPEKDCGSVACRSKINQHGKASAAHNIAGSRMAIMVFRRTRPSLQRHRCITEVR